MIATWSQERSAHRRVSWIFRRSSDNEMVDNSLNRMRVRVIALLASSKMARHGSQSVSD